MSRIIPTHFGELTRDEIAEVCTWADKVQLGKELTFQQILDAYHARPDNPQKTADLIAEARRKTARDGEEYKPIRFVLNIEVRTRGARHKEVWAKTEPMPLHKHCAEEMQPMVLQKASENDFGSFDKRVQFELEAYDADTSTAVYKEASYAKSDWFYRNIENFGFERESRVLA